MDNDGGGGGGDDVLRINHEILVMWKQLSSGRLLCTWNWHCSLW